MNSGLRIATAMMKGPVTSMSADVEVETANVLWAGNYDAGIGALPKSGTLATRHYGQRRHHAR
jgi:hypothetical protein